MSDPSSTWLDAGIEIAKYVLAAFASVASGACLWLVGHYRGHLAMLIRHEELLEQIAKDLGALNGFKVTSEKGPIGEELTAALEKLDTEDIKIHGRINRRRRENERMRRAMVGIKKQLENIEKGIDRIEKKQ